MEMREEAERKQENSRDTDPGDNMSLRPSESNKNGSGHKTVMKRILNVCFLLIPKVTRSLINALYVVF